MRNLGVAREITHHQEYRALLVNWPLGLRSRGWRHKLQSEHTD